MTIAQVVKTSVTVNNNSPIQDYVHPDDQTQPTFGPHYSLSVVMITRQFGNRKEIEKLKVRALALRQSFVKGGGGVG